MKRINALLLSTALLTAGPAVAQVIEDWDTSGDGVLSQEEWNTGLSEMGLFSDWDADGNGSLTSDEFAGGLFGRFDDDGDGSLTTAEWDAGIDAWYGENQVDLEYSNWDGDGDGTLSEEEFTSGFEEAGLFESFATSAGIENVEEGIGEEEFSGGLFDWFDADDDGGLIADEAGWFG